MSENTIQKLNTSSDRNSSFLRLKTSCTSLFLPRCRIQYGLSFYLSVILPLVVVMLGNITVFVLTLRAIRRSGKNRCKVNIGKQDDKRLLKACFSMFVLLGLTWLTGLLTLLDVGTAPQWIFTILVSTQGFMIFLYQRSMFKEITRRRESWPTSSSRVGTYGFLGSLDPK